MKKPDRRVFELTVEQLGVEAGDCVYIDDRRKNGNKFLRAGRPFGIPDIGS